MTLPVGFERKGNAGIPWQENRATQQNPPLEVLTERGNWSEKKSTGTFLLINDRIDPAALDLCLLHDIMSISTHLTECEAAPCTVLPWCIAVSYTCMAVI